MNSAANKWIGPILALQHEDGSWGHFHTLRQPAKAQPMSTEQALRRLRALGLSGDDPAIAKALTYMREVLAGKRRPPDRREHVLNWDAFEAHMMAAWIHIFAPDDPLAKPVARLWADLVTRSFAGGAFDENAYAAAYRGRIPTLHAGERLIQLPQFYMVNLLQGELNPNTERRFVDSIIHCPTGIYYVYGFPIADLPPAFASRRASDYLAALEQLVGYTCAPAKLRFAADWLRKNRADTGDWDLGPSSKDGVYFPLSASWRNPADRRRDCTARIEKLLVALA